MPLLRINADFLRPVGRFVLLGWLAEVWFLYQAFEASQAKGLIGPFESFDYSAVLGTAYRNDEGRWIEIGDLGLKEQFEIMDKHPGQWRVTRPYDPFLQSRAFIKRAHQEGACGAPVPEPLIAADPQGYVVALSIVPVANDRSVVGQARVRSFSFPPVSPYELAHELSAFDAAQKLGFYRKGMDPGWPTSRLDEWRASMASWTAYK